MTDVLWPPDLIPSQQTWRTLGNAVAFVGPLSGATKTYGRPGVRMGCTLTLPPVKGENRARMQALFAALKDRGNRIWIPDWSTTLDTGLPVRGSIVATQLFANNNFASGTTGWTATRCTLTAADRVLRLTNTKSGGANNFTVEQTGLTVTQYAPYALRSFISSVSRAGMSNGTFLGTTNYATDRAGLVTQSNVQLSATTSQIYPGVFDANGDASVAGDFAELSWTSFARCILVDGGGNALTKSDELDHANWTKSEATVAANAGASPIGTATGDTIIPSTNNAVHYIQQAATISTSAADYCLYGAFRSNGYDFVLLSMQESTSSTVCEQMFNLGTGALGSSASTGAGWSNRRAFIVSLGNGWYYCALVATKTTAGTTLTSRAYAFSSDSGATYAGNGTSGIYGWRVGAAQSSAPVRLTQSTTAAVAASSQTGSGIYVKGLPASTADLLKAGDMVQIGDQINRVTAPLNSDAAGKGFLQCANPWRAASNDAAMIVNTPMCKMIVASDMIEIDTGAAQFSGFQLELEEAIE